MSRATIRLAGIHARGRLGTNPGERDDVQELVVDLQVTVEVGSDELAGTADYTALAAAVRRAVEGTSSLLLESVAAEAAAAAGALEGVVRATATVHKPAAAAEMGVADVCAEATAE